MRVLFVEPAKFFAEESMNKVVKQTPHIGLAYVATATKEAGHEVKILDVPAKHNRLVDYEKVLCTFLPDVVGFTAMTHNIQEAYKYAKWTKKHNPKILTVLGGPHGNARPFETLRECSHLDVVVNGEGEVAFLELLKSKRKRYGIIEASPIKDLDSLPFPDWSLYDYEKDYAKAYSYKFGAMKHIYPVQTMRGCPYNCVFCFSHGLGKGVRFRSAESIFEEIKHYMEEYSAEFFYFADSASTLNRKQTMKLCDLIIKEKLDIAWKCETHVNHVDRELLRKMVSARCELVFYGVESGNPHVQERIDKNLDLDYVRKMVKTTKEVGLKVRAGFILGLPFDTKKTVQDTINFAEGLGLEKAIFSILDVLPGTEVERMVKKGEGGLRPINEGQNWGDIHRSKVSAEVNDLTKKDLLQLFKEAYYIVNGTVMEDRLRKFCAELAYYNRERPEVLLRHIADNIGLIEAYAKQK